MFLSITLHTIFETAFHLLFLGLIISLISLVLGMLIGNSQTVMDNPVDTSKWDWFSLVGLCGMRGVMVLPIPTLVAMILAYWVFQG